MLAGDRWWRSGHRMSDGNRALVTPDGDASAHMGGAPHTAGWPGSLLGGSYASTAAWHCWPASWQARALRRHGRPACCRQACAASCRGLPGRARRAACWRGGWRRGGKRARVQAAAVRRQELAAGRQGEARGEAGRRPAVSPTRGPRARHRHFSGGPSLPQQTNTPAIHHAQCRAPAPEPVAARKPPRRAPAPADSDARQPAHVGGSPQCVPAR